MDRVALRVGAVAVAAALVAVPLASPAVAAEGIGKDAWWYSALKIGDAHKQTTGKGVVIAQIDTPVDPTVPELRGQKLVLAENVCGGSIRASGQFASHGTSMAVNILGSGRGTVNGKGILGMAPDATLRVYANDATAEPGLQCLVNEGVAVAAALDKAVADGARIINFSQGGDRAAAPETAAVNRAIAAGVVIVAAAGQKPDDESVLFPAAIPGVVAVAAIDRNAKPWTRNVVGNREAFVISAPGVDVPTGGFDGSEWKSTGVFSGTSESASYVSGGLALVAAKYPTATGNQLIQHLIRNPGGREKFGRDLTYGYGIMSVTKMLSSDPTRWPDVNPLLAGGPDATAAPVTGGSSLEQGPDGAEATEVAAEPASAAGETDGGGVPVALFGVGALVIAAGIGGVLVMRRRGAAA